MIHFSAPSKCCTIFIPLMTWSARSRISMSSQVIYGSHSAALITKVCTLDLPFVRNLICVGKVAPPKPTMPDARNLSTNLFLSVLRQSVGCNCAQVSLPSGVSVMHISGRPDGCGMTCSLMVVIVPEVGA